MAFRLTCSQATLTGIGTSLGKTVDSPGFQRQAAIHEVGPDLFAAEIPNRQKSGLTPETKPATTKHFPDTSSTRSSDVQQ